MHNLTIQSSDELKILSVQFGFTEDELKNKIIDALIDYAVIEGSKEECGKAIGEIVDCYDIVFPLREIFKSISHTLVESINKQYIISTLGDCPTCGCELETYEDGQGRYVWLNTECTNCDYKDSNEPDWDTMRGGYAYDC